MATKKATLPATEVAAAKKEILEHARAAKLRSQVRSTSINVLAIAQHQSQIVTMLQEVSGQLTEANQMLVAILSAFQKDRPQ